MAKNLLSALLSLVVVGWLATAQEKTTPGEGKTAPGKTADAKADAKAGDPKAGDTKAEPSKSDGKEAKKPHPKTEAFDKLLSELRDTIARLEELQKQYREVKPEGRAALEEEFEVKKAHAKKLLPQVTDAAKAAIEVEPTDPEVMDHLGALAYDAFDKRSAYEEAFTLAQLVLEKQPTSDKFRRPELFRIACVSAYYTGQFDAAEKFRTELEKYSGEDRSRVPTPEQLKAERGHWQEEQARQKAETKPDGDPQALPRVKLATTQGDIVLELFENEAPNTVANFITLVEKKFYDGKVLASQSSDISAGKALADDEDMDYTIACESAREGFRRHFRGSLAMAIPGGKDTGRSEFRIWLEPERNADSKLNDQKELVGGATVFGRVISGMEVLSKIRRSLQTGPKSRPDDKIIEATVQRKRPGSKYEGTKILPKGKEGTVPKAGTTPAGKTEPATKTPEKEPSGEEPAEKGSPAKGTADKE